MVAPTPQPLAERRHRPAAPLTCRLTLDATCCAVNEVAEAIVGVAGQLGETCVGLQDLLSCAEDLRVQMGCCSDACTAAIQKVGRHERATGGLARSGEAQRPS